VLKVYYERVDRGRSYKGPCTVVQVSLRNFGKVIKSGGHERVDVGSPRKIVDN